MTTSQVSDQKRVSEKLTQLQQLFDRPVIILAAPRSGSSFLFELLSKSQDFYTIGGESHAVIEGIPQFNLASSNHDNNELTAQDVDLESKYQLLDGFARLLKDSKNQALAQTDNPDLSLRFLEKTPKNSLRISMLNECFPDALFIYLYRDPRENISSIIDAWHSGRFITYPRLPGRDKPWSLLLPKNWQSQSQSSVSETACFQWQAANQAILEGLQSIEKNRWMALSYAQLMSDTPASLQQICDFCQITGQGMDLEQDKQRLSMHTLTPPKKNKWHKNAALIAPLLPQLAPLVEQIEQAFPQLSSLSEQLQVEPQLIEQSQQALTQQIEKRRSQEPSASSDEKHVNIGRNDPCHCQSGKRYKHCHGRLG